MSELEMHGPVMVEMKVLVISEEGKTQGTATIGMGAGVYPTPQEMAERLAEFADDNMPNLAEGYRLMNKRETWDHICIEKTGQTFALPGGEEWDPVPEPLVDPVTQLQQLFEEALNYKPFLHFELDYYRQTEWMVVISDKANGGNEEILLAQGDHQEAVTKAFERLQSLIEEWKDDQASK